MTIGEKSADHRLSSRVQTNHEEKQTERPQHDQKDRRKNEQESSVEDRNARKHNRDRNGDTGHRFDCRVNDQVE